MEQNELLKLFKIEDIITLPYAVNSVLFGDKQDRDIIFNKLLDLNNKDVSHDWFQQMYESELAQRNQNKQDFTPNSVSVLASRLTGAKKGSIYEPTAGNGSMIIADWWQRCLNELPFSYYPSEHPVCCWELSGRAIPILLLNLAVRGIVGCVYHGDVLEQTVKAKYMLINQEDDYLAFSDIIKLK